MNHQFSHLLLISLFLVSPYSVAATPTELLNHYQQQANTENSRVVAFNAQRGEQFFNSKQANDWSCSSCHTSSPKLQGKHAITGRSIQPMAIISNPKRFTDLAKSEKWFRRNCKDVLNRECSAQEKGDVLSYLLSIK